MSPSQSVPENAAPPDILKPPVQGSPPPAAWLKKQQSQLQSPDQHQHQQHDDDQVQALGQVQVQAQAQEHGRRYQKKMQHHSSYKNASSATSTAAPSTARSPAAPLSPPPSSQSPSAPPWPLHHPLASRSISTSLLALALAADSSDTGPHPQTDDRDDDHPSPGSRETTPTPESEARRNELIRPQPTTRTMVVAPAGAGLLSMAPSASQFFPYDRHEAAARARPDRLNGHHRGRGTSLERTEKEKRVQVSPSGASLRNAGDTALASPPAQRRTPTPADVIAKSPPTEGVRATYRAWRYPLPNAAAEKAWSINERGGDDQGGRVEKLITDAMAGVEPNNRSRKASHSLGFFKEGLPEDRTKKREARGRGRSKEGSSPAKALRGADVGKKLQESFTRDPVHRIHVPDIPSEDGNRSSTEDGRPASQSMPRQLDVDLKSAEGLNIEDGHVNLATDVVAPKEQVRSLPPQLLDEIRKHHNLTPGATKGTSFSRSLPVTESERPRDGGDGSEIISGKASEKDEDSSGEGAELSPAKSADEEDESGEEQISSALFLPHQSARDSSDGDDNVFESVPDHRAEDRRSMDVSNLQRWLEQYEVPSRDLPQKDLVSRAVSVASPVRVKPPSSYAERESVPSEPGDASSAEQEILEDSGYTTAGEDLIEDRVFTPFGSMKLEGFLPSGNNRHVSDELPDSKQPLEAIELIPYRHQVGGHTSLWRFSKRAVCKQLSNRENEFYEKVERYHPQLLKFLPRYIGVLNVTLEKQVRRKGIKKDGPDSSVERHDVANGDMAEQPKDAAANNTMDNVPEQPRIISQSMQHPSLAPIPTVTFADNRHIIPKSFLQPHPLMVDLGRRSKSNGGAAMATEKSPERKGSVSADERSSSRPGLSSKHANSWGATTINNKLRYQVFGEAFLQQPIPIHRHKKPASQNRSLPALRSSHALRTANSDSNLKIPPNGLSASPNPADESMHRKAMRVAAERNGMTPSSSTRPSVPISSDGGHRIEDGGVVIDRKTGTSAPEPEIASSPKGKRQRRYSSGGLRRKPLEVADDRGSLKYFEEADDAGYKGDVEEDVFPMDLEGATPSSKATAKESSSGNGQALKPEAPEPVNAESVETPISPRKQRIPTHLIVPRPLNPKEAQTQKESRVEYFLLLEDLTAGMKRPCIMDLKMGTRQYGVYANEKKQASQRRKGASTTSHELGVRVCGLQVWDVKTQSYIYLDKYFGRSLTVGREFQDALTRFLHDGVDDSSVLRHIPTILRKLNELEVLIRGLVGYRFYAASLLMVYDGEVPGDDESDSAATERDTSKKHEIDFKMADFANSVAKEGFRPDGLPCPPQHPESPDNGFLRGLRSLKKYFFAIQHELLCKEMGKASKSENGENGNGYLSYDDDSYISF